MLRNFNVPHLSRRDIAQLLGGLLFLVVGMIVVFRTSSVMPLQTAASQPTTQPTLQTSPTIAPQPSATVGATAEPTALPDGYTNLAGAIDGAWTPAGASFVVEPQPYQFTGERQGNRCRIALSPDSAGTVPQIWVNCSAIGQPEATTLPAPAAPVYVWQEDPAPAPEPTATAVLYPSKIPLVLPTAKPTADLTNPDDLAYLACLADLAAGTYQDLPMLCAEPHHHEAP